MSFCSAKLEKKDRGKQKTRKTLKGEGYLKMDAHERLFSRQASCQKYPNSFFNFSLLKTADKLKSSWRKDMFWGVSMFWVPSVDVWALEMHTVQSSCIAEEDQNRLHIFIVIYGFINFFFLLSKLYILRVLSAVDTMHFELWCKPTTICKLSRNRPF